jgi:hypothetical protein
MLPDPNSGLTPNQQAMLDLALACDLTVSDPSAHPALKSRHHAIKNPDDAAKYILEVEGKIRSRRKPGPLKKSATPPRPFRAR